MKARNLHRRQSKGSRACASWSVYAAKDHQGNKIQAAFPRQRVTPSSAESRVFTFQENCEEDFLNKKSPHFQFILQSLECNLIHLCSFHVAFQTIHLWIILQPLIIWFIGEVGASECNSAKTSSDRADSRLITHLVGEPELQGLEISGIEMSDGSL